MATESCPDCGQEVSDTASSCPHCGHELDDDPAPSPQPGWRSVGWALLFVLAIPAAVLLQYTQDDEGDQETAGPEYACTQFVKSRVSASAEVRPDTIERLGEARHRIEGTVEAENSGRRPFTCTTKQREDDAWELVEIQIDSAAAKN